jgi:nitrite reductase/ring-hydroxylating ferredoxin subunit
MRRGIRREIEAVLRGGSEMLRTVARTTDVEPGQVRAFDIHESGAEAVGRSRIPLLRTIRTGGSRGTRVTLANVAGTLFAIDDTCTHKGCSLGDGKLDGSTLQCACHGSRFDVTSGAVVRGPAADPVRTYAVHVANGEVQVDL